MPASSARSPALRRPAVILALLTLPAAAWANVGVPMIFVTLPWMVLGLAPIVVVEAWFLARTLAVPARTALRAATWANLVSTLVGMPLTWFVLVVLQLLTGGGAAYGLETRAQQLAAVTWQAPWLMSYVDHLHWMVPAATLALLVPFFATSWAVELRVVARMLPDADRAAVRRATRDGNLASYAALAVLVVLWLVFALLHPPPPVQWLTRAREDGSAVQVLAPERGSAPHG